LKLSLASFTSADHPLWLDTVKFQTAWHGIFRPDHLLRSHRSRALGSTKPCVEISNVVQNFWHLHREAQASLAPRMAFPAFQAVSTMLTVPLSAECLAIDYSHSRSLPHCDDGAQLTLAYVHEFLRWRPHRFNGIQQRREHPMLPKCHTGNGKGIASCSSSFTSRKTRHLAKSWIT
jgi:hypothetical protein